MDDILTAAVQLYIFNLYSRVFYLLLQGASASACEAFINAAEGQLIMYHEQIFFSSVHVSTSDVYISL